MDGMEDQRFKWGYFARLMHQTARRVAIWSNLVLVTDSKAIQTWYLQTFKRETEMITYGGCITAENDTTHRWSAEGSPEYFMVVARSEPENQILEICQAFISTSSSHQLIIVGAPIGKNKYWNQVTNLVRHHSNIHLAGSIWDRQRLCKMYCSTLGVIHGHTVGGTNPALVDALSHGCPVIAHNNPFNREVLDGHGSLWKTVDELAAILENYDPHKNKFDVELFLNRYNWAMVTQRYLRVMQLEMSSE
jgi:glycosyltransferase involved in cell wall biosynthesis